jgi:hypothetical protein
LHQYIQEKKLVIVKEKNHVIVKIQFNFVYEALIPFEERQYCGKFAAILPNVCHLYGRTIAGYYENVHERQTWKMEQNEKKNIWHPFYVGIIAGNS